MLRTPLWFILFAALAALFVHAGPLLQRPPPTLKLASATLTGTYGLLGAEQFRGIPFALAPTGERRFMPPVKGDPLAGDFDATRNPKACRQMFTQAANATGTPNFFTNAFTTFFNSQVYSGIRDTLGRLLGLTGFKVLETSEDCLYLNVFRPAGTKPGDKLPIVHWSYGGGTCLEMSIDMKQSIIHVTSNYRLGAYGFLPLGGGNTGLLDQRMALEWIQEHAEELGGDGSAVTLWGESAGAFFLAGSNEDEGTFLTLGTINNLTDSSDFEKWSKDTLNTTDAQYARLAELCPSSPAAGSPYNTGFFNQLTPQSKRVASVYGDKLIVMPRKVMLREIVKFNSRVYSCLYRGFKFTPFLGSFHIAEILNTYGFLAGRLTDEMQSRWISFINTGTPDAPNSQPKWPNYDAQRKVLTFDELSTKVELDNQRDEQHAFLEQIINV